MSDVRGIRIFLNIKSHNLFVIAQVANSAHWFLNGSRHEIQHKKIAFISRHSRILLILSCIGAIGKENVETFIIPFELFDRHSWTESAGSIASEMSGKLMKNIDGPEGR